MLKKSLLSVAIDKKKDILNILDYIQLEVDTGDPRVISDLFGRLVRVTCEICIAQDSTKILFEALRTFRAITSAAKLSTNRVIESKIIEQTISNVKEVLRE